jgi:hypothetical protein
MRATLIPTLIAILLSSTAGAAGVVTRVSTSSGGGEGNGNSLLPALSADGRYVAFVSAAPNLTPDDGDAVYDVFVRDRATGTVVLVSKSTAGVKGDRDSGDPNSYGMGGPATSADGRFVAFSSLATTLVPGSNGGIIVHDRDADADGVFDEPGAVATSNVAVAMDGSHRHGQYPAISATGRFVAFATMASDLVPADTNDTRDVFVRDRDPDGNGVFDEPANAITERVSLGAGGVQGNGESGRPDVAISDDGNVVAFLSYASNLIQYDTNDVRDVFVRIRSTGITKRVNVSSSGQASTYYEAYDVGLSGNGRIIAFSTQDPTLYTTGPDYGGVGPEGSEVLIHDRVTGVTTTWAEDAPGGRRARDQSDHPVLNRDGSIVAFQTRFGRARFDGGLEKNDVEFYVHDRVTKTTSSVSMRAPDGAPTTVLGRGIALSSDGSTGAFDSEGIDIVSEDQNGLRDVFVDSCPVVAGGPARFSSCDPVPFPVLTPGERALFGAGAREFQDVDTPAEGLGPVFNETSCAACHNTPWIGGTSNRRVTRIGADGPGGFDPLPGHGGAVIQTQGIATPECTVAGETVPAEATIVTERDPPALFGAGVIDTIEDRSILRFADPDDRDGDGVSGRPNMVGGRVGRFGRKAQIATLHEFAGDAYLTEMGITSPDFPNDLAPQGVASCDPTPDPEDDGTNVALFVDFLSVLAPTPAGQYPSNDVRREALAGRRLFKRLRCRSCHTDRLRGPRSVVASHGLRKVVLFTDLLLHDLGPALADGIEQGEASGSEFRTAPLAGVAFSAPYLHDGRAATLDGAILAHGGEAIRARDAFSALSAAERAQVRAFLNSL